MATKIAVAQSRIPYGFWRRLGLFRHGRMDDPQYAVRVFDLHAQRAFGTMALTGKTILELGPGDSLASAAIGHARGAAKVLLVDAGDFAVADIARYRRLIEYLAKDEEDVTSLLAARDTAALLERCHASYLTQGLESVRDIETASVDYIWSHSVLEHIPLTQVAPYFREFHRILRPGGLMSHNIDFQDHLDHSLNSLRFSERVWESFPVRQAGFYTNRMRAHEMHRAIVEAGFSTLAEGFGRWPALPIPRRRLAPRFRAMSEDELLIRTSHILARAEPATFTPAEA